MERPFGLRPLPNGGAARAAGRASRGSATSRPLDCVDKREAVGIVFGGNETACPAVDQECGGFTNRRYAFRYAQSDVGQRNGDELAVARRGDPGVERVRPHHRKREFSSRNA